MSVPQSLSTPPTGYKRHGLLIAGGLGLAGVGLAAGMMLRAPAAVPAETVNPPTAAHASAARTGTTARGKTSTSTAGTQRAAESPPLDTQAAALCARCGVVEGVRPVEHKGEGSGLGAVAGGVVGAVVGHQMGGGSGKKAMTVLGALGGGVAGNEIEKHSKTTTVYEVRVRMDDGSLRTFTSATAPAPGAAVTVDDKGFHLGQRDNPGAPRMTRTAG